MLLVQKEKCVKITDVSLRLLSGSMPTEGDFWEDRLVRPLDVYPEHKAELVRSGKTEATKDGLYPVRAAFVEIHTDQGLIGLGGPIQAERMRAA